MTTYTPEVHVRRRHVSAWLVAVIVLAAALAALGTWVVVDRSTGAEHDATTLIDDINTAFSTGDADAIASLYAKDAVIRSIGLDETYTGVEEIRGLATGSFTVERIAPVTVDHDYATTFVRLTSGDVSTASISVFQIQDGKIVRQWNFVPGMTAPFDNAVLP